MTPGPRIGVLTTSYPRFDGDLAGHFIENAAELLTRSGYRLEVIAPHGRAVPRREAKRGIAVERFRYAWPDSLQQVAYGSGILANLRSDPRALLSLPGFVFALLRAARRLASRSDLIHAHWIPSGLAALLARGRKGPGVIVTIRGSDLPLARRSGSVRRLLGRAARIIAVSETMRAELIGMGFRDDHVVVVREAIQLSEAPPRDRSALRQRLGLEPRTTVLFLGRLSHVKGPDLLMEAASSGLLQQTNSQLVFLGAGNMEGPLRRAAAHIPERRIRFEGFVPHGRISDWLEASDLLVLPSRSEGLPLALIEALSLGVPVVASEVGGIPEVVRNGETGWLVPQGDVRALEMALREALSDLDTLRRMGQNGRLLVRDGRFDLSRMSDDLNRVYSEALTPLIAAKTALDATSSQSNR